MFFVNIDVSDLQSLLDLPEAAKEEMKKAGEQLTAAIHGHILEEAEKKLHTRRQMFVDGLKILKPQDNLFVVSLDAGVRWIDDGLPEHNMLDKLLASPKAKDTKDGGKYIVIPFQHNKGPTQMTPAQSNLLDTVKKELKRFNVPYGKLETDDKGQPKIGKLHSFDIMKDPVKTNNGPGQGQGPIGQVKQGPTGIPFLQGLQIHQKEITHPDGKKGVGRFIMTFRVASSKHAEEGNRWNYPGTAPMLMMEEAVEWAQQEWDNIVAPKLLADLIVRLS